MENAKSLQSVDESDEWSDEDLEEFGRSAFRLGDEREDRNGVCD